MLGNHCSWPTAGATPAAKNERHAAWEALFLKKTSATLHGSAPGRQLAPSPRPRTSATLHGKHFSSKKRAPRCMGAPLADTRRHQIFQKPCPRSMGIIFFQKNERHAAWERSCRSRVPKVTQDKKITFLHQKY